MLSSAFLISRSCSSPPPAKWPNKIEAGLATITLATEALSTVALGVILSLVLTHLAPFPAYYAAVPGGVLLFGVIGDIVTAVYIKCSSSAKKLPPKPETPPPQEKSSDEANSSDPVESSSSEESEEESQKEFLLDLQGSLHLIQFKEDVPSEYKWVDTVYFNRECPKIVFYQ